MERTKPQVRDDLRLDELPDDEFMQLLAETGEGPTVAGPTLTGGEGYTPEQLASELTEAISPPGWAG